MRTNIDHVNDVSTMIASYIEMLKNFEYNWLWYKFDDEMWAVSIYREL